MNKKLKEKIAESLSAVLPITVIVVALCITVTPMPLAPLTLFLAGACLLIIGMGFFTLGADMAMMPIGEHVGSRMAKFKKLGIIALLCFFIGAIITIAEPDLKVLAHQMPSVPDMVLILSVACGVGAFLALSFLRTLFGWNLSTMLMVGYAVVFLLTLFVPQEFLAVAFDSGGVTTGPMTVPFIMALGLGLASIGKSEKAGTNSFGMIALCSLGPILAVLLLGLMYDATAGSYTPFVIPEVNSTRDLGIEFGKAFPAYLLEVTEALLPVLLFFLVFQIIFLRLRKKQLLKILMGMVYTFIGLTLFLTGVNVGFMPVGNFIGAELASAALQLDSGAAGHAHWLLYCQGGTGGAGIEQAGGGHLQRRHFPADDDGRPVHWHGHFRGVVHAAGAYGAAAAGHPAAGLCAGAGVILSRCRPFSRPLPLTRAAWPPAP